MVRVACTLRGKRMDVNLSQDVNLMNKNDVVLMRW
jgi:hypothetical protein